MAKRVKVSDMVADLLFEKRSKNVSLMMPESILERLDGMKPDSWSRSDLMLKYIIEGIERDKRKKKFPKK